MVLSKSILGHKESILSLCESILGFGNTSGLRYADVGYLVVNFGHLGVNVGLWECILVPWNCFCSSGCGFSTLRSRCFMSWWVDFRSLEVDIWPLMVDFGPLILNFGLSDYKGSILDLWEPILRPYESILGIWESFYISGPNLYLRVHVLPLSYDFESGSQFNYHKNKLYCYQENVEKFTCVTFSQWKIMS